MVLDRADLTQQNAAKSDYSNEIGSIVDGANKLGADLLRIMSNANNNGSLLISPLSLQIALHILMQGAGEDSETLWEIENYLDYDTRIKKRGLIHEAMASLMTSLELDSGKGRYVYDGERNTKWWKYPTKFNIANMLIFEKQIANGSRKDFQRGASKYYDIDFHSFDRSEVNFFANLSSRVNNWISSKTENSIQLGLDTSELMNSIAVLINAVYLRGQWLFPFCESNTKHDTFSRRGDKSDNVTVPFMSRVRSYSYLDLRLPIKSAAASVELDRHKLKLDTHLDCQVVLLPIDEDGLSMVILLPSKVDGFNKLYDARINRIMDQMLQSGETKKINLKIPRFALEVEYNMKHHFRQLGLKRLSYSPELHRMFELLDVDLDWIAHKAKINVTEMGIGAPTITAMKIQQSSNDANEIVKPIDIIANHPFLYAVIHESRPAIPLLMGQVISPN